MSLKSGHLLTVIKSQIWSGSYTGEVFLKA